MAWVTGTERRFMRGSRGVIGSDFAVTDLTGLEGWYDAGQEVFSDLGTTPATDTDEVYQWNDVSGNSRNTTNVNATPHAVYDAVNAAINNMPCLKLDGTNVLKSASFTAIDYPIHLFMVMAVDVYASNDRYFAGRSLTSPYILDLKVNAANSGIGVAATSEIADTTNDPTAGTFVLIEGLFNGASSSIIIGDATPVTGDIGVGDFDIIGIGGKTSGGNAAEITVAEIIVTSAEVTGADLTNLRSYINTKYGVTTT